MLEFYIYNSSFRCIACFLDLKIEEEEENRKEGKASFRFTEEEPKDEISLRCVAKRETSKARFSLYTKL